MDVYNELERLGFNDHTGVQVGNNLVIVDEDQWKHVYPRVDVEELLSGKETAEDKTLVELLQPVHGYTY